MGELARVQYGVVSRGQLLRLGIPPRTLERWIERGRLVPIHRKVFALGHDLLPQRGRRLAAVLALGDGAVLSHGSAAALWGLRAQRGRIDINAPSGRQGIPRRAGIRLHRCRIAPEEVTRRDRIPVTTVARTLFDLAEAVDTDQLRQAWEEAARMRRLHLDEMQPVFLRGRGRVAARRIKPLIEKAQLAAATRSPLEDRFAAFLQLHSIPPPAHNVLVLDHEVDVFWPAAKLIVELDSWGFHGHRAAFNRDRARDSARTVAGYRTIRVTHDRLDHEAETLLAELRMLLALGV